MIANTNSMKTIMVHYYRNDPGFEFHFFCLSYDDNRQKQTKTLCQI